MEHVVFHPGPDGAPAFRRLNSREDAVRFVEHLRNVEGVTEVSVHELVPVPVSFRTYYRVEVPADEESGSGFEPSAEVPAPSEPVFDDANVAEPVFADASTAEPSSNGRRSLGFFSH
jgi:hypothetical protein